MHHRLRVYEAQAAAAQTPALKAQYKTNMEQIRSMIAKEPVPRDDRSMAHEIAAQILALDSVHGIEKG